VWRALLVTVAGWVGYSHQWKTCDRRFKTIAMASCDTEAETWEAWSRGWRTFRVRGRRDGLIRPTKRVNIAAPLALSGEFACPASDESQHRSTCQACQLCRGTASPARSVVIMAHGNDGVKANFYRRRSEVAVA
jgi:hypothetical protein